MAYVYSAFGRYLMSCKHPHGADIVMLVSGDGNPRRLKRTPRWPYAHSTDIFIRVSLNGSHFGQSETKSQAIPPNSVWAFIFDLLKSQSIAPKSRPVPIPWFTVKFCGYLISSSPKTSLVPLIPSWMVEIGLDGEMTMQTLSPQRLLVALEDVHPYIVSNKMGLGWDLGAGGVKKSATRTRSDRISFHFITNRQKRQPCSNGLQNQDRTSHTYSTRQVNNLMSIIFKDRYSWSLHGVIKIPRIIALPLAKSTNNRLLSIGVFFIIIIKLNQTDRHTVHQQTDRARKAQSLRLSVLRVV